MEDQPTPFERQYAEGLSSAIEVMSAIVEAYENNGDQPDSSLADYITKQKIGKQDLPPDAWTMLSGLANLAHLLLGRVEELSGLPKQESLDLYADAAKTMAERGTSRPRNAE
jgi:hypothetical protein